MYKHPYNMKRNVGLCLKGNGNRATMMNIRSPPQSLLNTSNCTSSTKRLTPYLDRTLRRQHR